MPSRDDFHEKNPAVNAWLRKGEKQAPQRQMSAQVARLADRSGRDSEELAKEISPDTLRRTKYPVLEEVLPDGKRIFRHDIGVIRGARLSR